MLCSLGATIPPTPRFTIIKVYFHVGSNNKNPAKFLQKLFFLPNAQISCHSFCIIVRPPSSLIFLFYTLCWVNVAKTPIKLRDDSHFRVCSLFSLQAFYPYIPEVPLYTSLSVFFAFFLVIFTPHQTHLLVVVSSETRSSFSSIDVVSLSVYVRLTLSLFLAMQFQI